MKRPSAETASGAAKAAKLVQDARDSAGSNATPKLLLEKLVKVLTALTLINSAELREITGFLYVTYLMPAKTAVVIKSLAAGAAYFEAAKKQKEAKAKGGEGSSAASTATDSAVAKEDEGKPEPKDEADMEVEELGPPHLQIGTEGLEALIGTETTPADVKLYMEGWWQRHVQSAQSATQLQLEFKSWRCRKPAKPSTGKSVPKGSYAKLSFAIRDPLMEEAVCRALEAAGGMRKLGTAPMGLSGKGGPGPAEAVQVASDASASLAAACGVESPVLEAAAVMDQTVASSRGGTFDASAVMDQAAESDHGVSNVSMTTTCHNRVAAGSVGMAQVTNLVQARGRGKGVGLTGFVRRVWHAGW